MFGIRLKALRKRTRKTQVQVASELGLTQTQISTWEQRLNPPNADIVNLLAAYYRMSPSHFTEPPPHTEAPTMAMLYVRAIAGRKR